MAPPPTLFQYPGSTSCLAVMGQSKNCYLSDAGARQWALSEDEESPPPSRHTGPIAAEEQEAQLLQEEMSAAKLQRKYTNNKQKSQNSAPTREELWVSSQSANQCFYCHNCGRHSVSQRGVWVSFGHPVSILDTLFYLSFTCKSIVSEQFGHPVLKFSSDLDTLILNPG